MTEDYINGNYLEAFKKIGRPLENFKHAGEMLEVFELYLDYMKEKVWYKSEVLKGGDFAGTIVKVPVQEMLSVESFCLFAGISKTNFWYELFKPAGKSTLAVCTLEEFREVAHFVRDYIEAVQLAGGAAGAFNASIVTRKLRLTESVNTTLSGDAENPIEVKQVTGMVIK